MKRETLVLITALLFFSSVTANAQENQATKHSPRFKGSAQFASWDFPVPPLKRRVILGNNGLDVGLGMQFETGDLWQKDNKRLTILLDAAMFNSETSNWAIDSLNARETRWNLTRHRPEYRERPVTLFEFGAFVRFYYRKVFAEAGPHLFLMNHGWEYYGDGPMADFIYNGRLEVDNALDSWTLGFGYEFLRLRGLKLEIRARDYFRINNFHDFTVLQITAAGECNTCPEFDQTRKNHPVHNFITAIAIGF